MSSAAYSPQAPDDATLLQCMGSGDEQALGVLYDRWQSAVRAVAMRIVQDAMDVDDIVEEVFWQAWRQAERFDADRGGASTWLLTIARSRSLDKLRAVRRSREDTGLEGIEDDSHGDALAVSAPDPMAAAELSERGAIVREALASLPVEQREALVLGYFDGLSQSEIAEKLGQPLGTVKTRMRLALRKLKDKLGVLNEEGA
jgi:RNA polymerase sigma-70 factor (ECF subfamily)